MWCDFLEHDEGYAWTSGESAARVVLQDIKVIQILMFRSETGSLQPVVTAYNLKFQAPYSHLLNHSVQISSFGCRNPISSSTMVPDVRLTDNYCEILHIHRGHHWEHCITDRLPGVLWGNLKKWYRRCPAASFCVSAAVPSPHVVPTSCPQGDLTE